MPISRRNFLRDAGSAALATAVVGVGLGDWLGGASALAAGGPLTPHVLDRLASLPRAAFASHVGRRFKLHQRGIAVQTLVLEAIEDGTAPRQAAIECFSLRFRGAARSTALGQGTYALSGPSLGRFGLFLVPMGDDGAGPRYEAVINRLLVA